jgi:hypothetical protein
MCDLFVFSNWGSVLSVSFSKTILNLSKLLRPWLNTDTCSAAKNVLSIFRKFKLESHGPNIKYSANIAEKENKNRRFKSKYRLSGFDILIETVSTNNLDVMDVIETWLNESISSNNVSIDGFTLWRVERASSEGVSLYYKYLFSVSHCVPIVIAIWE